MIDIEQRNVRGANSAKGDVIDVVVCTTGERHVLDELPLPAEAYRHHPTSSEPLRLPFECRSVLREALRSYDYYCYLEDDLVIHDPLFFAKLRWFSERVGDRALLQPNRYERDRRAGGRKVYVDGNIRPGATASFQHIGERSVFVEEFVGTSMVFRRPTNPHSGCYFLNNTQLQMWVDHPSFADPDVSFVGPLESGATLSIMRTFEIYKPSRENASFLEIEHADRRFLGIADTLPFAADDAARDDAGTTSYDAALITPLRRRVPEIPDEDASFSADLLRELGLAGLNCGSGATLHRGCLNTDRMRLVDRSGEVSRPGRLACLSGHSYYLEHDATRPFPIASGSFDWVFSEHFIEHISPDAAVAWLTEMRRLLRPGGFLRLSTPDLKRYAAGYLDDAGTFFDQHRRLLLAMGMKQVPDRRAWMMNQIFRGWRHEWIYDMDEIAFIAAQAGFAPDAVTECAFRQGRSADVARLDRVERSDESLYVEIVRL